MERNKHFCGEPHYRGGMSVFLVLLTVMTVAVVSGSCPAVDPTQSRSIVFKDIHDGDYKLGSIAPSGVLTIKPYNNTESWTITAGPLDDSCAAIIDFNVPGKPNPPPVKLLLTMANVDYLAGSPKMSPAVVFTDPSGTLGAPTVPLNIWYGLRHGVA